jgi:hypothetical protein
MGTYRLLFPNRHRPHTEKLVKAAGKDTRLWRLDDVHDPASRPPESIVQLYERYPRWGPRLEALYEEVNNPSPTTWLGRYSDRRKSPRHSYVLTYLAVVLAFLLGIITIALGIIQVLISYCDWKGDIGGFCGSKPSGDS